MTCARNTKKKKKREEIVCAESWKCLKMDDVLLLKNFVVLGDVPSLLAYGNETLNPFIEYFQEFYVFPGIGLSVSRTTQDVMNGFQ